MVKSVAENPHNRSEKTKGGRTYSARKDCIKRKTRELSILCGITACTVIVSPDGEVDTWPENPTNVKSIIDFYKEHNNHDPRGKKSPQSPGFPCGKISLNEFLWGWKDDWIRGLSSDLMGSFLSDLESKLQSVESRIDVLNERNEELWNPEQGKSMVPFNGFDPVDLGQLEQVHSTTCMCCYHLAVYLEPWDWNSPSDENNESWKDCNTLQFLPMGAIYSQPLLLDGGSLNGYGCLDQVDEDSRDYYFRQFSPLNG